jgi:hypothetical protein
MRLKYRQIADLCNNCTAPPWNGEIGTASGDEWTATFVDGHNRASSTHWHLTSRNSVEILLYDVSRDLYARLDLTKLKGYLRKGTEGDWINTTEILGIEACR